MEQTTDTVLMIEPINFHYNAQTAVDNFYQKSAAGVQPQEQQEQALREFQALVALLRANGIRPLVVADTPFPETPDALFPNNWISFHEDGRVAIYPMFAPNRRLERRGDILERLEAEGFQITGYADYSDRESRGVFLEGTGSMVLDRSNRIAYALLSERTHEALLTAFCADFHYRALAFHAEQDFDGVPRAIYHTNVMMAVAEDYAVISAATLRDLEERERVIDSLQSGGKEVISITPDQVKAFAGNMLQLRNAAGDRFLLMSTRAYQSLRPDQIQTLERFNPILHADVSTIEQSGGGGVRCMLAEVFLPRA